MMTLFAQWFIAPVVLTGFQKTLLILPLCLSISIVYKATRMDRLRDIPLAVAALWITLVLGMYAVGVGVWAVFEMLA